jgi:hypothetical protein
MLITCLAIFLDRRIRLAIFLDRRIRLGLAAPARLEKR